MGGEVVVAVGVDNQLPISANKHIKYYAVIVTAHELIQFNSIQFEMK